MTHTSMIGASRRQDAGESRGPRVSSDVALFRHTHAGRYFGCLWYKVFSERGPC